MKTMLKISAAVLCAGAMVLSSCNSGGSTEDAVEYLPVKLSEKGDWGFIGPDGKMLYEDEFKSEPSAVVEGFFAVNENNGITIYKADSKKPVELAGADGLYAAGHFSNGLCPVTKKKERISVIDTKGDVKYTIDPVDGKEIISTGEAFADGFLTICNEDYKGGYINEKGEVVVKPKYDSTNNFSEGLALVYKVNEDTEIGTYSVINTTGEEVFKFKKGHSAQVMTGFSNGYISAVDEDGRCYLYDKKGEMTKLSSKVQAVEEIKDGYMIFRGEDGCGVMKVDGLEEVVRPKYYTIYFYGDKFVCNKDDDEGAVVLDRSGEEVLRIEDYSYVLVYGRFGMIGRGKNSFTMLDKEGQDVKDADFSTVNFSKTVGAGVNSDYFNMEAVVGDIVGLITDKGVGRFELGEKPAKHLKNPDNYTWTSTVYNDSTLAKSGYRYDISGGIQYNGLIALYDYAADGYVFNNEAEMNAVQLSISTQTEWGNDGSKAVVKALKAKGFKVVGCTKEKTSSYFCLLRKGNVLVGVLSEKEATTGQVLVVEWSQELEDSAKQVIDSKDNSDEEVVVEEVAEADYDEYYD